MRLKSPIFIGLLIGAVTGLLSTYPIQLGGWVSLTFWAFVGVGIGVFWKQPAGLAKIGSAYGLGLSIAFLYSRFGGTPDKLLGYTVLVAAFSLVGMLAGIATTWMGEKLRTY